ncbi:MULTISPECIES: helix-turn-helix domain-containing protein [Bacillaceae]|uniref:Helix-turn-helix domain-containing protein n=1 Tax=Evansella alkalicola TaxID=745819 RepID=A0ABS6K131_9BACI|nr:MULTISPECIES: helix-turn-helix transcriptional regulator [Bacillaceae]MBU9723162.1 helix-turn-helix domain-containing protein [Bacillus alkalicola]
MSEQRFDSKEMRQFIGMKVRDIRIEKGLTHEKVAEDAGLNEKSISRIEKGETDIKTSTLFKLGKGLGLTNPSYILEDAIKYLYSKEKNDN